MAVAVRMPAARPETANWKHSAAAFPKGFKPECRIPAAPTRYRTMPQITTRSTRFPLQEGESLLDALERTGHEIGYQCRSGYCGSCRVRLLSGSVSYADYPLAMLLPGEILACCCTVNTDISIDCAIRRPEPDLFDRGLFGDDAADRQGGGTG